MSDALTPADEKAAPMRGFGRWLRATVPIVLVTALAMFGQILFVYDAVLAADLVVGVPLVGALALALAVLAGVAYESITLHVQWHAHDSLLHEHTLTAARQRKASYLIALVGALVNYSHFANPDWSPTVLAVMFATFSLASPPLWGLHTRRLHKVQLSREGRMDTGGVVFSAERYRWFPWRTLGAVRWSIDHFEDDPRTAWDGYGADLRAQKAVKEAERAMRRGLRSKRSVWSRLRRDRTPAEGSTEAIFGSEVAVTKSGIDWPLRVGAIDTDRDMAIVNDLRLVADHYGQRPARDTVAVMYGIGTPRAERLLGPKGVGWRSESATDPLSRRSA